MRTSAQIVFLLLCSCLHTDAQVYNYYFGNLHSHSGFSDGNKDSLQTGVTGPAGSYAFAKLSDNFDFLGISEHNHYSSSKNPGFRLPRYQEGLSQADAANEDGNFVALFGMEYGVSSDYHGHVLVYGFDQLIGWETGVGGMTGNNYDIFNAKSDYAGLFTRVKNKHKAFCYLAHPAFDNYSTGGTWETALVNAPYNAAFDSAIVGMPLRNGLATSAAANYTDYPQGNFFNYYKKMLYQGYHLGIGYDHDNHYTNFGRGNGGRLVIMAPSLNRDELYKAMHAMRFYGSDDPDARIMFTVNDSIMGSVFNGSTYPLVRLAHTDGSGENADTIKIWRGYKNSGGLWASIIYTKTGSNFTNYTDYGIVPGREYYYFAEIRQEDGQWIVTSPVWYTASGPLRADTRIDYGASVRYVAAQERIEISLPVEFEGDLVMTDLSGREMGIFKAPGREFCIETGNFQRGLYLLEFMGHRMMRPVRIVIY